jgi:hypothetical protein
MLIDLLSRFIRRRETHYLLPGFINAAARGMRWRRSETAHGARNVAMTGIERSSAHSRLQRTGKIIKVAFV